LRHNKAGRQRGQIVPTPSERNAPQRQKVAEIKAEYSDAAAKICNNVMRKNEGLSQSEKAQQRRSNDPAVSVLGVLLGLPERTATCTFQQQALMLFLARAPRLLWWTFTSLSH